MKEENKPAMNIQYREPIKGSLLQGNNFKVKRLALAIGVLAFGLAVVLAGEMTVGLVNGWHLWHLLVTGK